MSSKADDFDVRYRAAGTAVRGRPAAGGGYRGSAGDVDYDLGYDSPGWDTEGFRRPEDGFTGSHEPGRSRDTEGGGVGTAVRSRAPGARREGSHARAAGPAAETGGATRLSWPTTATGGPRRPPGPRGLNGPGRRGRDRTPVKVKGAWWRHWTLRKALGVLLGITGVFVVLGAVAVAMAYEKTPVPTEAMAATSFTQSVVYSKDGTLIGRFGTTNRKMLSYGQIQQSKWLIPAVLAAEDRNFFHEGGVSPTGIVRAAYTDLTGGDGSLQGGSTVTQEFVRQYYAGIGTQQTVSRKIKEIFVAIKVAKEKSKQWILQNYLNTIYLGDGAYGIGAAAQTYYNVSVSHLTAAQAAVIAAIIQQPSTYPLPQYRPQLENRWHYVLNGMVQMGTLTQRQADAMKFPAPGNHVPQTVGRNVWDPYVLGMVQNELEQVYHLNKEQIYNGGYVIRTSVDDAKMAALYQAVNENEQQINLAGPQYSFKSYMRAAAVLEDPGSGAIQAVYAGPGFPGQKYNGVGHVITARQCKAMQCQYDMATLNREQVGSSFKPYILALAVKQGMNVQTSTLDGFNPLSIPPDTSPDAYAASTPAEAGWSPPVKNDSAGENGPYTPQMAMAASINTAYADLWHVVAGPRGQNVVDMAKAFGVDTSSTDTGFAPGQDMANGYSVALGAASLTVGEQASMLATIDDNGVYHDPHVITSITRYNAPPTPIQVTSYPVFSSDPTLNANEASQVQYAMSEDTAPYGTAPGAAMSNGQQMIAKTGTTETAQSAFFVGAIPSQALAVALFTHDQTGKSGLYEQTLNGLGGNSQGGFGGTWPAAIWHTYAENMFVPLGVQQFPAPVFTGTAWNEVPPALRNIGKKPKHDQGHGDWNGHRHGGGGGGGGQGFGGGGGPINGVPVGAIGVVGIGLPAWVRRRKGSA